MTTNTKNYDMVNYVAEKIIGIGDFNGVEILGLGYAVMITNGKSYIDEDYDNFMHDTLLCDEGYLIQMIQERGVKYVIITFNNSRMKAHQFMDSDYAKRIKSFDIMNLDDFIPESNVWMIDKNKVVITLF